LQKVLPEQSNKKLKKKNITSTVWKTLSIIYTERAKENTRQIMKSNFAKIKQKGEGHVRSKE